jgi:hypothetical protein
MGSERHDEQNDKTMKQDLRRVLEAGGFLCGRSRTFGERFLNDCHDLGDNQISA